MWRGVVEMEVLIVGAGIAGPTLAYWLLRGGHRPTLVERAPQLRRGGGLGAERQEDEERPHQLSHGSPACSKSRAGILTYEGLFQRSFAPCVRVCCDAGTLSG